MKSNVIRSEITVPTARRMPVPSIEKVLEKSAVLVC
jgi:hypothetical protein